MGNFEDLFVWRQANTLAVEIYKITGDNAYFSKDFSFARQMRRAVISISSNIAEGDESGSNKNGIRYFNIAKGSAAELLTQLIIANNIGYLDENITNALVDKCRHISIMLHKLIQARKISSNQ